MLRIYIPTYNRWDRLGTQLSLLRTAQALGARFTLEVFDNASTDGTADAFSKLGLPVGFGYRSFAQNIGFEGNVMRILKAVQEEASPEDHLWILGDDDFVNPCALVELTQDAVLRPNTLILLKFLQWRGRTLGIRPCNGVMDSDLSPPARLFAILTDATLISGWLYPCSLLSPGIKAVEAGYRSNAFLQLVLLAHTLVQGGVFLSFERVVGVEYPTVSQRFKLKETWAVDRPLALAEACKVLRLPSSLAQASTRRIAETFYRRALAAAYRGDMESSVSSCEALEEFSKRRAIWVPPSWIRLGTWLVLRLAKCRAGRAKSERETPVALAARALHAYHRPAEHLVSQTKTHRLSPTFS